MRGDKMNILNELNEACNYIENNIENEIDIKKLQE